ncbi:High chlorophyll fluorescence 153 [Heracleum sosnowskyi]|uniref:High chlorophyll fluorescence 153 n=1 Tax=Heracleum sosnowskyi TaxID=360622 RepID=A0AAD8N1F1_9APIA|nr:High chlorophyll fluorescence 153 [Heracleum sosnowskyi]
MIRGSPMASHTCCFFSSNTYLRPSSLTTTCLSPTTSLSPVVFSGGLKSRRGWSVVTRAVPGPNTYIFAFVFPLSLLVATVFTTLRISDKLDEDFLQELAINQAILEASEDDEDDGTSTQEPETATHP